jgi:beta-lactamase regulating signal transducer with metallopeptidase domain
MLVLVIDVSIRALAAAAAIAVVLRVLRVRSAALRHGAWASVMVVMLAMPLLTAIVPGVAVPVPSTLAVDPGTVVGFEPRPARLEEPRTELARPASSTAAASAASTPTGDRPARVPAASRTSALAALVVYFAGAALLAARLAAGWMMARGLRRTAAPALVRASVPVVESAAVAAPLAVGVFRPVIVLPVGWQQWRDTKLAAILAHETAHIERRDGLIALLAEVNRVVFWFHPLAWWLPRTLAAQAELACDDVATEAVEGRREYAEVLVEVAEAVSSRGHRVAWQGLGVDGTGLLGSRIERLLRGDSTQRPSRSAVAATALACAIVLGGAVACRQEPPPLQPDPELAKQYAEEARDSSEFQASRKLRLDEVDALEKRIDANPNDWDARRRLVTYYNAGEEVPWERKVPGLRRHALWLIEHHPEHEIAAPPLSPQYDPEGFAAAVRLWDQHLGKSDVSPYLVYRAAQFFAAYDRPRAEALILRGMKIDPNSDALKARMPPRVALY